MTEDGSPNLEPLTPGELYIQFVNEVGNRLVLGPFSEVTFSPGGNLRCECEKHFPKEDFSEEMREQLKELQEADLGFSLDEDNTEKTYEWSPEIQNGKWSIYGKEWDKLIVMTREIFADFDDGQEQWKNIPQL